MFLDFFKLFIIKGKKKQNPSGPVAPPSHGVVYIAKEYPPWQKTVLVTLRKMYEENGNVFPESKAVMDALKTGIPFCLLYAILHNSYLSVKH